MSQGRGEALYLYQSWERKNIYQWYYYFYYCHYCYFIVQNHYPSQRPAIGNSQPQGRRVGDAGSVMQSLAHEHLQVKTWELGCFLLPFQVQNVYVHFPHVLISKPICTEYKILLNFPSNKQTKEPRAWKNIGKQKQAQRLLIIVLGFITEGPQRGHHWESDPAWSSGELKCCGYIKIVNDF